MDTYVFDMSWHMEKVRRGAGRRAWLATVLPARPWLVRQWTRTLTVCVAFTEA